MTTQSIHRRRVLAGGAGALAAAIIPARVLAQGKDATIHLAYNLPKDTATGTYFETLAQEIEKNTAATSLRVKVRVFPNGQLYNDTQLPDAVATGALEIGQMNLGFMTGPDVEPLRLWGLPFLYTSWEALWTSEDNPRFRGAFATQFGKVGMHFLGWVPYGTVEFFANRAIKLPDDLKGLRLRAFGVDTSLLIRDLGASPVSLSSQEMYQAVQRGTIDGFISGPTSVYSRKLYEVTKFGTSVGISFLSFMATASQKWWDELPSDAKEAISRAAVTAQQKARDHVTREVLQAQEQLAKLGVSVAIPSAAERAAWVAAASKRYDEYRQKAGEDGRALLAIVQESNAKYPAR